MNGFVLIDKPAGMTSHDVIDRLRKITGVKKIGHAGTLDPFATGLLLVAIGPATKKLSGFVGLDKTYETAAMLGVTSTTYDIEGEKRMLHETRPAWLDTEKIESALRAFRGGYDQKAPLFSAKKVKGKKLYELARKGKADESLRPIKPVLIDELSLLGFDWPRLRLRIRASSGTYVRSLVHDIGEELRVGAYAEALRRTEIGPFSVENALALTDLTKEQIEASIRLDMALDG